MNTNQAVLEFSIRSNNLELFKYIILTNDCFRSIVVLNRGVYGLLLPKREFLLFLLEESIDISTDFGEVMKDKSWYSLSGNLDILMRFSYILKVRNQIIDSIFLYGNWTDLDLFSDDEILEALVEAKKNPFGVSYDPFYHLSNRESLIEKLKLIYWS